MICSMTAFARNIEALEWGQLNIELKSVNSRYLETSFRIPEALRHLELDIRERIKKKLNRGKVDCMIKLSMDDMTSTNLKINKALTRQLMQIQNELSEQLPSAKHLSIADVLKWPGVVQSEETDLSQLDSQLLTNLDKALNELVKVRAREGEQLRELIVTRVDCIEKHVIFVNSLMPEILEWQKKKLQEKIGQVSLELDNDRIEQEFVILAQKIDVSEEMDRLSAHLVEVKRVLNTGGVVGRRLDFLMQELNREANTLGSKSINKDISAAAVEIKVLIEQMREQIQNIE